MGLVWDFHLPRVHSINASSHKYGVVLPGVGWVMWREQSLLLFLLLGPAILGFFGISISSFQIAGGLLLAALEFDMMKSRQPIWATMPIFTASPWWPLPCPSRWVLVPFPR